MPHVIVKLLAGRSEAQKQSLAAEITRVVMAGANCPESAVSVGFEDIAPGEWTARVYTPDIAAKWDSLAKKPGYTPD